MKLIAFPVKDLNLDVYRILVMREDGDSVAPILPKETYSTREEAQTAAYALVGVFNKSQAKKL